MAIKTRLGNVSRGLLLLVVVAGCSSDPAGTAVDVNPSSPGGGAAENSARCAAGLSLCGAECANLATSSSHCGTCDVVCNPGQSCAQGQCVCPAGFLLCGTGCMNVSQDAQNCGQCGKACSVGGACENGQCVCLAGLSECAGACVNLQSDGANCGACGTACLAGEVCSTGICGTECTIAGQTPCGQSCVDLQTDATNCGQCNVACAAGQICSAGACVCTGTQTACGGTCVDTLTDSSNCGSCGVVCAGGSSCQNGTCVCPSGQQLCGTLCTDVATDASNCGSCGNVCGVGQSCQTGSCVGGTAGTGGASGTGGVTTGAGGASGGTTGGGGGTGGATGGGGGSGGISTGGASSGTGGSAGTGGSSGEDLFTVTTSLSSTIESVGIVEWSVNATIDSAHIDFGRDASAFEFTAPVDSPSSTGNVTLLLGMKPSTKYSLQIVASGGGSTYTSSVYEITTGAIPNGLPTIAMDPQAASGVYEGFTIGCFFGMSMGGGTDTGGGWAFILDKDGTYVWWYRSDAAGQDCVRARMSYNGQYMWMANGNVPGPNNGTLVRVRMDGTEEQSYGVPWRHHDVCIQPDETVAYFEYKDGGANACDVVKELNPETEAMTTVYDVAQASPSQAGNCHSNAINWWPDQNIYTFSVMYWDSILAFTRSGELSWVFGGTASTYSGASWSRQHQHHLLSDSSILLFNNDGSNGASVLEYQMANGAATLVHDYANGHSTQSMGDVKRLPNGNTLVTYSNQGVIQEVDSSWQVIQEITTSGVGYIVRRATLYGPPPPYVQ